MKHMRTMALSSLASLFLLLGGAAGAQQDGGDFEREPSAVGVTASKKRTFPGGADEEDLRVQTNLPDAAIRTDARTLQRDVYRSLYNQELKDDRQDAVEE
ncbi:MAG: hypothetical protein HC888_12605 [Candidatus Competibacteraceae bacterium]|nr:hypothetical protein [Candidatus Competibacteraceae bacterium]